MSKRITQSHTPEFRAEAIKLVFEQGFSVAETAARLNMKQSTLAYWVTQARKADKTTSAQTGMPDASDLMAKVRQLRKELAEARMERDILKKATAYFARESLPGTRS
ncbi:transposase [Iodobacter fluviatilis]|uniref:Transposase n=1 Tax=Iodobacter fluviatilis TaxID=537 RepID=A0A377Q5N6_9NEIS|nr:transposase [Iodobacter fluviatilis]TCU80226.1 transposase [Iodobacter fluviatilis]STQ90117.1 Transposase [Iodobacter fluviatilis]